MGLLSVDNLKGTWGTVLLPVNADNSIDYGCLSHQLDFLCSSGISGIYSNGTAGEFFNQTEEEFDRIQFLMAEKCNKNNVPFQIGVCSMSPILSLKRIEQSIFLKPGAYQVIFPQC
jgi:dihydrodipicolinate synthase/N-acetylneuraminate lyase